MKFALAFSALASAATNQAPVISLNLESQSLSKHFEDKHVKNNAFADECGVSQNGGAACVEPTASAYDHHDGEVQVTSSYTLFVESQAGQTPVNVNSAKTSINLGLRGEWIIKYEAKDADGNEADAVTFALILTDVEKPQCGENTPGCSDQVPCLSTEGNESCKNKYRSSESTAFSFDNSVTIELCGGDDDGSNLVLSYMAAPTTVDLYDGTLNKGNSLFTTSLKKSDNSVVGETSLIPETVYAALTSDVELHYTIESADFADIFGEDNKNNLRTETGTVVLTDTRNPTILTASADVTRECGYCDTADFSQEIRFSQSAAYTDCYDDWTTVKNKVTIGIEGFFVNDSGSKQTLTKPFDAEVSGEYKLTADTEKIFGCSENSKAQTATLSYDVKDIFGNTADTASKTIEIKDTLAPTLYITEHKIRDSIDGANCHATVAGTWSNTNHGDFTSKHCTYTWDAIHGLYELKKDDSKFDSDNAMGNQITIQHSAGYADDYNFIEDLMKEGTGYSCIDACSATTTSVKWVASCDSETEVEKKLILGKAGTYFLKYTCNDEAAHSTTACRTFENEDKTKPIITCLECANDSDGTWRVEASRDSNYVDAGATCTDMVDGNLSQNVEVSGDVVNMAVVGTYKINYNCQDSAGIDATKATRTVIVQDTTCPSCKVPTEFTDTVEASFPYTNVEYACTDSLDGVVTGNIAGSVDVELTGTYVLTYTATDAAANSATAKDASCGDSNALFSDLETYFTKTVIVQDTMKPIISLTYKDSKLGAALMAESTTSTVNGWVIGAIASAVSGVALLGYAATRKATVATSVPV